MPLRTLFFSILCFPGVGYAQYLPKEFAALNFAACSGKGLSQLNTALNQNLGLGRKHRSHLLIGVRASYIRNTNNFQFSPPRNPEPDFVYQYEHVNIGSVNMLFGFKTSVTQRFSLGANFELLGVAFGSSQSGNISLQGKTLNFDGRPMGTNFLLNGSNGGSLHHILELGYTMRENLIAKIGVANQRVVYNFKSNLDGFGNFTQIDNTTGGFVSLEWIISCKR